jgi:uncharacterized protein (DUF2236 family)
VIRNVVRSTLEGLFGADRFPEEQYDAPLGDEGLFGSDSVAWRIHADTSMFVGGIAALLLQSLHPRAAAVVSSSSNFRERPLHRLSRTGSFVAATTFAATPVAEAIIDRVRRVHDRIPGAGDPDLITWVHVAEVTSFLAAYRRYHPSLVWGNDVDRYFAETAVVAERLGGADVPKTAKAVRAYYEAVRPELATSSYSDELLAFIHRPPSTDAATRAVYDLFRQAAEAQLPGWARELYGMRLPPGVDRFVLQPATWSVLEALRLAGGPSPILAAARARASAVATAA